MPLKIVRNDITRMPTDAIVNTTNRRPIVGAGCDTAIYNAAGYETLLAYRKEHIGDAETGESFITPGFSLPAKYIIHTVSPLYKDGSQGEEELLRNCYRNSLRIARENKLKSLAFPLISTGSFGYPKEEGMRIAVDEINAFLMTGDMLVYLVVFGDKATELGSRIYPELKSYVDKKYIEQALQEEYSISREEAIAGRISDAERARSKGLFSALRRPEKAVQGKAGREKADLEKAGLQKAAREEAGSLKPSSVSSDSADAAFEKPCLKKTDLPKTPPKKKSKTKKLEAPANDMDLGTNAYLPPMPDEDTVCEKADIWQKDAGISQEADYDTKLEMLQHGLNARMDHLTDTFSEYLLYLIQSKGMENAEVWKRGIVDKKVFSKIKNHPEYHPNKMTALCLCVGAQLNLDETRDLLARAGYALSPCDKTDIIFSFFIENKIYDMIELDLQLEEFGLPCIIA